MFHEVLQRFLRLSFHLVFVVAFYPSEDRVTRFKVIYPLVVVLLHLADDGPTRGFAPMSDGDRVRAGHIAPYTLHANFFENIVFLLWLATMLAYTGSNG